MKMMEMQKLKELKYIKNPATSNKKMINIHEDIEV